MRDAEAARTIEFLDSLEFYDLNKAAGKIAGESLRQYRVKGITLSLSDVSMASIAIANDLVLLTDNVNHYPQAELRVETI
jgi:predicted nucleic acid-binding protein